MVSNPFRALSKSVGEARKDAIDVSSRGNSPYNEFSPFTNREDIRIPVPGMKGTFSESVEGIWQGLKIIRGQTEPALFTGKPKKRSGKPTGHLLGNEVIGYADAREKIYEPSYTFFVTNHTNPATRNALLERGLEGEVSFYDTEENISPQKLNNPVAHSAYLARIMNRTFTGLLREQHEELRSLYRGEEEGVDSTLQAALTNGLANYDEKDPTESKFFVHATKEAAQSRETYFARFAQRLQEQLYAK